jgi:hypothetical protein
MWRRRENSATRSLGISILRVMAILPSATDLADRLRFARMFVHWLSGADFSP